MTTIFAVSLQDPNDGYILETVFSSLKQAQEYVKLKSHPGLPPNREINEIELDEFTTDKLNWIITFYPERNYKKQKWNITYTFSSHQPNTIYTQPTINGSASYSVLVINPNRNDAYKIGMNLIINSLQSQQPEKWINFPFVD
jgi:hypothetical protein